MKSNLAILFPLVLGLAGIAQAAPPGQCRTEMLRGTYVLAASGFTRPPTSAPGTPWVPKAIVEVVVFNGDGTATSPFVAIANPFGDAGNVVQPPAGGANGLYTVNDDCTGTVHFLDATNVTYSFVADPVQGDTLWMLQVNPPNNVFQAKATRVR